MKKNIVLGITGGIAVYKIAELCSLLVKNNFNVKVIMTENATKFVAPLTFFTLSKNPVITSLFNVDDWKPEHVELSKWAELFVVAPATANFLGKMANGIADDALSTFALTVKTPVLLAPAMNPDMWSNPAVIDNCAKLAKRSIKFIGPVSGHVACGPDGVGRMSEVASIFMEIEKICK